MPRSGSMMVAEVSSKTTTSVVMPVGLGTSRRTAEITSSAAAIRNNRFPVPHGGVAPAQPSLIRKKASLMSPFTSLLQSN